MSGWAAAIGAAMDIANTGLGLYKSSKAYRRAKQMYQHRYQWAVDDMRKAGLNPVLAATGGGVSTSGLNAGQVGNTGNFGSNAVAAYKASQESKLMDSQINAANASAAKDQFLGQLYVDQANNTRTQTNFLLDSYEARLSQEASNATSAYAASVMDNNARYASDLSTQYMRDNPNARDFGNMLRLINPSNSASSLLGSFGKFAK